MREAKCAIRMKKGFFVLICAMQLAAAMLLSAGCEDSPDWQADLRAPDFVSEGEPAEFVVQVKEGKNPVSGLHVTAEFEMKRMDHGSVSASFTEISNGLYTGTVQLPMTGDWSATVSMTDGKRSKRQTFDFHIRR